MNEEEKRKLKQTRHQLGIYSIAELSEMFNVGRHKIDFLLNTGLLKYISPNGRTRYIFLKEYVELLGIKLDETKKDSNLIKLLSDQVEESVENSQLD